MSMDISTCKDCNEAFVYGSGVNCDCGIEFCSQVCANSAEVRYDEETETKTCKFCREEDYDDSTLFNFILKECGITREQVIEKYKELNKKA